MATGQFPKRREGDAAAKRRAEKMEEQQKAIEDAKFTYPRFLGKPRISSSGKLTR